MTDLKELWHLNKTWRAWMDENTTFVTPEPKATLQYMANETAEASEARRAELLRKLDGHLAEAKSIMEALGSEQKVLLQTMLESAFRARDVLMRTQYTSHARNNARPLTTHEELADCAMLALTALPEPEEWPEAWVFDEEVTMDAICDVANQATVLFIADSNSWALWTLDLLSMIDHYPGMALRRELVKCHDRLGWKWGSNKWVSAQAKGDDHEQ